MEEGFSNMSSTSIPPTVKALLITLVVYIVTTIYFLSFYKY